MQVAQTILNQMGGKKFIAMVGAKNLTGSQDALCMQLPKNNAGAKYLRIELNADDTYTMIFRKGITKDCTFPEVSRTEGVYADMLQELFTAITGLDTKL
ncbi:MAG TPA: hypothetical protein VGN20_20655 [Mucilaginibacter sp.]|jgi:hypothetical protein